MAAADSHGARVVAVLVILLACVWERGPSAVPAALQAPQTQAQQRPVFRGGTHFVRVDAYPLQDGKIVEGLEPADFDVLEDGKPQTIESFDYVRFDPFTAEADRREPSSQRESFDLAADPRNRVFVIFVDMVGAGRTDVSRIQRPLANFLDRIVGPSDLFALVTSRSSAKDLVLGRRTQVIESQIMDLFRSANIDRDDADELFFGCPFADGTIERLKNVKRMDASYEALEGTVAQLGAIRQERKSIIFVSNVISRAKPASGLLDEASGHMPRAGVTRGRIGIGNPSDSVGATNAVACTSEAQRLAAIDFDQRYRDLLVRARRENVSFYPVAPAGLQAPATAAGIAAVRGSNANLLTLASETDGIAIVDANDLNAGMKRIADDMQAYYVLGYYTTNTKFDGGIRKIAVKVKGKTIRARREYRAPTEAQIAALANAGAVPAAAASQGVSPREAALTILERANRPFVPYVAAAGRTLTVVAELSQASIQAGRWKDGAEVDVRAVGANDEPLAVAKAHIDAGSYSVAVPLTVASGWPVRVSITLQGSGDAPVNDWVKMEPPSGALVGEAVAWRTASRVAPRPVAAFEFARNERIRAEWPI
jgi:VWFA-related protein